MPEQHQKDDDWNRNSQQPQQRASAEPHGRPPLSKFVRTNARRGERVPSEKTYFAALKIKSKEIQRI
jgi:hypothetical protein